MGWALGDIPVSQVPLKSQHHQLQLILSIFLSLVLSCVLASFSNDSLLLLLLLLLLLCLMSMALLIDQFFSSFLS